VVEPGDVADLGDEHRCQDRSDARDLLHREVSGIGIEATLDRIGEHLDLEVQISISRRSDAIRAA